MKLLIATRNPGKFLEITEVLHDSPIQLLSLKDFGYTDEVEEHGATHENNAFLRAWHFYKLSNLPTLGEDSGIYVDAFPCELGVKTRR